MLMADLTTIRLSRYPATKAKYQWTLQHFTRDARSIMGRNGHARKHLDMIAPLPRRALCCGCALHNRAGHVASSRGPPERSAAAHAALASRLPFVSRTDHRPTASIQDVRVDHRRPHVPVPEQLLNGPDVVAVLEQVRGKRVAQRVTAEVLLDPRSLTRCGAQKLRAYGFLACSTRRRALLDQARRGIRSPARS
jgi:hypothetical protein